MRLNGLGLAASIAALAISLSAEAAVPAQSAGSVTAQRDRQAAIGAAAGTSSGQVCPPGYYWEPDGYAAHGKFRPAHCARR